MNKYIEDFAVTVGPSEMLTEGGAQGIKSRRSRNVTRWSHCNQAMGCLINLANKILCMH